MRDLSTTAQPPRPAPQSRLRALPALFAALLCCAGLAGAQEPQGPQGQGVRRPSFNFRPFEDLALEGKRLVEAGKLGRETVLDVTATAEVTAGGRFKPETVEVVQSGSAGEAADGLVRRTVAAVSESGLFGGLEGAKSARLGLKLDRQNVSIRVEAEMPSADEAHKYAMGYDTLRLYGSIAKRGTDEGVLFERLRFASDGKMFKMTFEAPRDDVTRIIADALEKSAAKRAAQ